MLALKHLPDVTEDVLVFVLKRVLDAHIERKLVSMQVNGAATERRSRTDPPDLHEFVYRFLQCSKTPGLLKVAMKAQLPLEHTQALLADLENIVEASSYSIWSDRAASRNTAGHQFNQVCNHHALFSNSDGINDLGYPTCPRHPRHVLPADLVTGTRPD